MSKSIRILSVWSVFVFVASALDLTRESELLGNPKEPPTCEDCCKAIKVARVNADPAYFPGSRTTDTPSMPIEDAQIEQETSHRTNNCPGGAAAEGTTQVKKVYYDPQPVVCVYDGTATAYVECTLETPSNFTVPTGDPNPLWICS